jgi:hypothetical protein
MHFCNDPISALAHIPFEKTSLFLLTMKSPGPPVMHMKLFI